MRFHNWTALVILIVVIGGIGTIEGPIIGTVIYFLTPELLADFHSIYLMLLGALAIVIMLVAPKGIWGICRALERVTFPTGYVVNVKD